MRPEAVVPRLCLVALAALMGAMAASAGPSETWKSQIVDPGDRFLSNLVELERNPGFVGHGSVNSYTQSQ